MLLPGYLVLPAGIEQEMTQKTLTVTALVSNILFIFLQTIPASWSELVLYLAGFSKKENGTDE